MAVFDPSRLYVSLLNTGLQQKDNPLYQVIHDLIGVALGISGQVSKISSSGAGSAGSQGIQGIQGLSGIDGDFFVDEPLIVNSMEYTFPVLLGIKFPLGTTFAEDALGVLSIKAALNQTNLFIYNTFTDASNYERVFIGWSGNTLFFTTNIAGTGVARNIAIGTNTLGTLDFRTNGQPRWEITAAAGHIISFVDNTMDIGAVGANRPRTGYFGTSIVVPVIVVATSVSTPAIITAAGALTITPAAGSGINIVLSTTGDFSVNTNQLYVDTSTGRVGIGLTEPLALLEIDGNSATVVQAFIHNVNGGTSSSAELVFGTWSGAIPTGTGNPGPSAAIKAININAGNAFTDLTLSTYGGAGTLSEIVRVTNTGNVGIGTTNPLQKLVVSNAGAAGFEMAVTTIVSNTAYDRNALAYVPLVFAGSTISFKPAAANGWTIDGSSNFIAVTDNTYDIGAAGATRPRTGYFGTSIVTALYSHSGPEVDKTYQIYTPLTATTVTMSAGQSRAIINPAGLIAALTITLPPSPVDGQVTGISFTQAVTVLTVNAPGGATVVASPTSAAIDTNLRFLYQASSTSWFPAS